MLVDVPEFDAAVLIDGNEPEVEVAMVLNAATADVDEVAAVEAVLETTLNSAAELKAAALETALDAAAGLEAAALDPALGAITTATLDLATLVTAAVVVVEETTAEDATTALDVVLLATVLDAGLATETAAATSRLKLPTHRPSAHLRHRNTSETNPCYCAA